GPGDHRPRPALPVPGLCCPTGYRRDPPLPVVVPRRADQYRQRHPAVLVAPHPGPPASPDHHPTLRRAQPRPVDVHDTGWPDARGCSTTGPGATGTRGASATSRLAATAARVDRAGNDLGIELLP